LIDSYNSPNPYTFGLTQQQGGSGGMLPINAVPMLTNDTASFTPLVAINIGTQGKGLSTSTVLSSVWGPSTPITFIPSNPVQSVVFNDQTNKFDPA